MTTSNHSHKPALVVVGAGVAGTKAAALAVKSGLFSVTVIEPREFYEVPYATVRAIVDPAVSDMSVFPYKDIAGGLGTIIHKQVKQVLDNHVILESGEDVAFDYVIIATGAIYSVPGVVTPNDTQIEERRSQLKGMSQRVAQADSVVVVGGGSLGLEVVGEIITRYPRKRVTLIHGGVRLLEGKPVKLHDYFMKTMNKHKVEVLLSEHVERWDESSHVVVTRSGKQVPAQVVVWATGSRANSAVLKGGAGEKVEGAVDEKGMVKVDEYLRLKGSTNIFVIGDVNDTPQFKMGFLADLQADLTIKNLTHLVTGGKEPVSKWVAPFNPTGAMLVTWGKQGGAGHVGSWVISGWIVWFLKGHDLGVSKTRKLYGIRTTASSGTGASYWQWLFKAFY